VVETVTDDEAAAIVPPSLRAKPTPPPHELSARPLAAKKEVVEATRMSWW
jgi:hypothetical protein